MCHTDPGLSRSRCFQVLQMVNVPRQSACLLKALKPKACSAGPADGIGIKEPRALTYCFVKGDLEEGLSSAAQECKQLVREEVCVLRARAVRLISVC